MQTSKLGYFILLTLACFGTYFIVRSIAFPPDYTMTPAMYQSYLAQCVK